MIMIEFVQPVSGGGVDFQGHRQELPERRSRSPDRYRWVPGENDAAGIPADPAWECKGASPPPAARCRCVLANMG